MTIATGAETSQVPRGGARVVTLLRAMIRPIRSTPVDRDQLIALHHNREMARRLRDQAQLDAVRYGAMPLR